MNRKKRRIGIGLLVLLLLVVPSAWITYREFRQESLDHALIKARNDTKALEALAEGASGEARDNEKPPTFKEVLLQLFTHLRHPGAPASSQVDGKQTGII